MQRELQLCQVFVELADTLVGDYEPLDFLYRLCDACSEALEVDAVGVLLTGRSGVLELCAASSESMRLLELFELQQREGPCLDAYHLGQQVVEPDLQAARDRWPRFAAQALQAGFGAVHAFPLRLRDERIGALNMFRAAQGTFDEREVVFGQALADVATVGIMQARAVRNAEDRAHHLQTALDRRVIVEQAKGAVAERLGVGLGEAFEILRRYARRENRTVLSVSQAVLRGTLQVE